MRRYTVHGKPSAIKSLAFYDECPEEQSDEGLQNNIMPWVTLVIFIFAVIYAVMGVQKKSAGHKRLAFAFFAAAIGTGFINYVAWITISSAAT